MQLQLAINSKNTGCSHQYMYRHTYTHAIIHQLSTKMIHKSTQLLYLLFIASYSYMDPYLKLNPASRILYSACGKFNFIIVHTHSYMHASYVHKQNYKTFLCHFQLLAVGRGLPLAIYIGILIYLFCLLYIYIVILHSRSSCCYTQYSYTLISLTSAPYLMESLCHLLVVSFKCQSMTLYHSFCMHKTLLAWQAMFSLLLHGYRNPFSNCMGSVCYH